MNDVVDKILSGESITKIREARRAKKVASRTTKSSKAKDAHEQSSKDSRRTKGNEHSEQSDVSTRHAPVAGPTHTPVGERVSPSGQDDDDSSTTEPAVPLVIEDTASEALVVHDLPPGASPSEVILATDPPLKPPATPTTEELVVQHWWQAYTCHAVRVTDLKAIFRETAFAKHDIARLLERMHGTVVAGYMIVSVPTVQDKRVHQLIPIDFVRPDYLTDLTARLAECNAKLKEEKHV